MLLKVKLEEIKVKVKLEVSQVKVKVHLQYLCPSPDIHRVLSATKVPTRRQELRLGSGSGPRVLLHLPPTPTDTTVQRPGSDTMPTADIMRVTSPSPFLTHQLGVMAGPTGVGRSLWM